MKTTFFAVVLACLLLTGCIDEKAMYQKFIPKDEDALARHFIELIRTGDYDTAEKMLSANLQDEQTVKTLQLCHGLLAHGTPLEIETIGSNVSTNLLSSHQTRRFNLSYQIHFKDSWLLSNVVLDQTSSGTEIVGFHCYPARDSLENINHFTLSGKSPVHFAVLTICVLIPTFMIYALVVCICSPIRRKWLWLIFILFGIVKFHFNWTTGYSDMQPFSISLFDVGVFSSGLYGPWIFHWSLPVGALIFLVRRRKLTKPHLSEVPNLTQSSPLL